MTLGGESLLGTGDLDDAILWVLGSLVKDHARLAVNVTSATNTVGEGGDRINLDLALLDVLVALVKNVSTASSDKVAIGSQSATTSTTTRWCRYSLVGLRYGLN